MRSVILKSVMLTALAMPAVAQERWETFRNSLTERQGAYMCSDFNAETGSFFCMELACDAGAPLTVELSRHGSALEPTLSAAFTINGIALGSHAFERSSIGGYANYRSTDAARDEQLRYWLRNGRSVEIAIGDDVVPVTLAGSSAALNSVLSACPIG